MTDLSTYLDPVPPNPSVPPDKIPKPEPPRQVRRVKPAKPTKEPRRRLKRVLKSIAIIIGIIIIASIIYVAYKFVVDTGKVASGNIFGLFSNTKLKGEDQGRVNILLAGDSSDDPGHGGADLTDSIMVISINTQNNTAMLLSIPRDMWVNVPGHGYEKINAVYEQGGMSSLEQVAGQITGMTMDYYALSDYTAFRDAVNAVGGITVDIQSPDPRGIYDPNIAVDGGGTLKLANGVQTLNGQTALNLARARNDPTPSGQVGYGLPNGDFDRTADQRLMLEALKTKITTTGVLANPVKIGELLDSLGNNLKTDFQTDQLVRLYDIGKKLTSSNLKSVSLSTQLTNYTSPDGESALVPIDGITDYSGIQAYIKQQTSTTAVGKEGATAVVLNASGTNGLAKSTSTYLTSKGIDVTKYATSPVTVTGNTLVDNSGGKDPATLALINSLYNPSVNPNSPLASEYGVDFVIILGPGQTTVPTQ
jgi:LCP family protein required for cell wall assembly